MVSRAESLQLRKEKEQSKEVGKGKYHCYESIVGAGWKFNDKTPFVSGGKKRVETVRLRETQELRRN